MSEAAVVLDIQNVTYWAGSAPLVNSVSMKIHAGEVVGLLGPNGAGKSTLLKLAAGELRPAQGIVVVGGDDIAHLRASALAARRAVVAQSFELNFPFTAREVVLLGATVPGFGIRKPALEAACGAALRAVGLDHLAERAYPSLSGGERQRVHIARALCQLKTSRRGENERPLLLLDEPTSSLDIAHQRMALDVVRQLAADGAAVMVVLHDVNLAAAYCSRIFMMSGGHVVASGAPQDVVISRVLSEAYGCPITANTVPPDGRPFALPV